MSSFSFTQWYQVHGEQLNEKRRGRYHTDPEYRKHVLEQNRESRRKRRQERIQNDPPGPRQPVERKSTTIEIGGVEEKVLTISGLAEFLGCSVQAVRLWERQGILPETPLRAEIGGARLYTAPMSEQFKVMLEQQGRLSALRPKRPERSLTRYIRRADGKVKEVQVYLIGALAVAVNRTVGTLEQMEAKGYLPPTPFRASRGGRRFYTEAMIEAVKEALQTHQHELRGETWKRVHDEIVAKWKQQHIIGAVLIEEVPQGISSA